MIPSTFAADLQPDDHRRDAFEAGVEPSSMVCPTAAD
jgi:hypothetical protein